jgi:hypothetical protein
LLIAGIAVLVLGAVGFAGFKVNKSKNDISAKAAGWTTVVQMPGNGGQAVLLACKQPVESGYCPLWQVKTILVNGTKTSSAVAEMGIYRDRSAQVGYVSHSVKANTWGPVKTTFASRLLNDT